MGCPAEKPKTQDKLTTETLALASLNQHCCLLLSSYIKDQGTQLCTSKLRTLSEYLDQNLLKITTGMKRYISDQ